MNNELEHQLKKTIRIFTYITVIIFIIIFVILFRNYFIKGHDIFDNFIELTSLFFLIILSSTILSGMIIIDIKTRNQKEIFNNDILDDNFNE